MLIRLIRRGWSGLLDVMIELGGRRYMGSRGRLGIGVDRVLSFSDAPGMLVRDKMR